MKKYITTFSQGSVEFKALSETIELIEKTRDDIHIVVENNPGGDVLEYFKLEKAIENSDKKRKYNIEFCGVNGSCAASFFAFCFAKSKDRSWTSFTLEYSECSELVFHKPRITVNKTLRNIQDDKDFLDDLVNDYKELLKFDLVFKKNYEFVVDELCDEGSKLAAKQLYLNLTEDIDFPIYPHNEKITCQVIKTDV